MPPPVERETYAVQLAGGAYVDFGDVLNPGTGDFQVAFTAKPRVLDQVQAVLSKRAAGPNFIRFPGAAGAYVSSPDPAWADFLSAIDIRAKLAADDWTPASRAYVLSKDNGAGQRSFYFAINTDGTLRFSHSEDGTAWLDADSTVATGVTDGATKWIRATLLEDNGSGERVVTFYLSDDGAAWTQLGDPVNIAGPAVVFDSTARLQVSDSQASPGTGLLAGELYYLEVRDTIGGTVQAKVDPSAVTPYSGSFVSSTGETWTVAGTAAVWAPPGWEVYWDASGNLKVYLMDAAGGYVDSTVAAAASWAAGVEQAVEIDFVRAGSATCRKDGVQVGTLAISTAAGSLDNASSLLMGLSGAGGRPYDGTLDEVAIHLVTFNDAGLAGRWPFDEGQGTRAADTSGYGRGGTLVAGAEWVSTGTTTMDAAYNDLEMDGGLGSAVLLSLFSDRRAGAGDALPDQGTDRRGWWADAVPIVAGDQTGSLLWLLRREKLTPAVVARAQQYATEALAWMLEDKVADKVEVVASSPRAGWLVLEVTIHRPKVSPVTYRYDQAWDAQAEV